MSGCALIAVTHLLGSGHWVRAAQLARALAAEGFSVTLASGGMPLRARTGEPFALLQLPPVRVEGVDFRHLLDEAGRPATAERMAARQRMLEEAALRLRPDVVVTEHFPFGRRQLAEEFLALIAAARRAKPEGLVLSSIRDVLVTPKPARIAEAEQRLERLFDAVLIHGEESVLALDRSWPVTREIAKKLHYVGYLAEPRPPGEAGSAISGEILVSGGGSAAGLPLFERALDAARIAADRRWRILVGGAVPEADLLRLRLSAPDNAVVERARPDFPALLGACAVSVSQAGYNTVLDLVTARRPAILVPFDAGGETEQGLRAEAFAASGLAQCLRLDELDGARLAAAVEAATGQPAPAGRIAIDGGERAAATVRRLLEARRNTPRH